MKRLFPYLIIIALAVMSVSSCKKSERDVYAEAVEEWIDKEILFPDSMMTVTGEMIAPPTADFTIVSYYDSTGCTECKMQLPLWSEFMRKLNTNSTSKDIALLIIVPHKKKEELFDFVGKYGFISQVVVDEDDIINRMNNFPERENSLRTFLIDNRHLVVAVGNPISTKTIERFYYKILNSDGTPSDNHLSSTNPHEFDFGKISPGECVTHKFLLKNTCEDTLKVKGVYSSCECTEGAVSSRIIPPGAGYNLEVIFCDTTIGDFYRVVSISFENDIPGIDFEISGRIR